MLFGHGLGMNVHEDPVISIKNERSLKENMILAIEPRSILNRKVWC